MNNLELIMKEKGSTDAVFKLKEKVLDRKEKCQEVMAIKDPENEKMITETLSEV